MIVSLSFFGVYGSLLRTQFNYILLKRLHFTKSHSKSFLLLSIHIGLDGFLYEQRYSELIYFVLMKGKVFGGSSWFSRFVIPVNICMLIKFNLTAHHRNFQEKKTNYNDY